MPRIYVISQHTFMRIHRGFPSRHRWSAFASRIGSPRFSPSSLLVSPLELDLLAFSPCSLLVRILCEGKYCCYSAHFSCLVYYS
ncbi:hypothetical protein L1987_11438 [Smallanthus sonchifolius]|uniref:Uncharacterized protein n=1 Tax=Smallanthus sonchifolius TaxID=185202 RepID=A0ACB9JBA9_9ASTR|nr:hypothetical protein L1987_11438 [Smallanthus sonchifolius]